MEITMNHEQYMDFKSGLKTKFDIKLENIGIKNKRKLQEKTLVVVLGTTLFIINNCTKAYGLDFGAIDSLGMKFLMLIRKVGYWILLITSMKDILKVSTRGGNNASEIGKTVITFLLLYACLYGMPDLFNLVEGAFKQWLKI